ncbi:MAG: M48 family metallopeptidase [Colwellia sp.]
MIDYQVIRSSRRKTVSLQVKHGQVVVRAPNFVKHQFISAFIKEKSAWLQAKIAEQVNTQHNRCNFTQNSTLLLQGNTVTLNVIFSNVVDIYLSDFSVNETDTTAQNSNPNGNSCDTIISKNQYLNVVISYRVQKKLTDNHALAAQVKKQLEKYFKQQAEQIILAKLAQLKDATSFAPKSVKVRQYRARWGSCNSRGELSFNYLLMMVPDFVLDYVLVHELCHLRYLNHSTDFWQLVAAYYPNYLQAKRWLKDNQTELAWSLSKEL